jgi:(1->4)-alpha-D-glucan 1-alpha-D-glucosylmutase
MTETTAPPPRRGTHATVPRATYRVQLHSDFRFADATALVPYWAELGISHLYCSPVLRARPGSRHGYDVVDHGRINPELGTREDFEHLVEALHAHGMGLLVDIVPNHMGVLGGDNAWWLDVLEHGPASAYALHFDIDWQSADPALAGRVLLPILGDQYGLVLEAGELTLRFDAECGSFALQYYEHRLPLDPASYATLLRAALQVAPAGGWRDGTAEAIDALARRCQRLPPRSATDPATRALRQREQADAKARLAVLARSAPAFARAVGTAVARFNGAPGQRNSFDALDALIDAQAYRLAHWRIAGDEINYRRFFDINDLAALRMERAEVFEATHRLVLQLAAEGRIDGLRIDHPDGLADPAGYFARLQQHYARARGLPPEAVAAAPLTRPLYVALEKITAPHEQMPSEWAVHGTTGYRFANVVNGVLIEAAARSRLDRVWRAFVGEEAQNWETLSWRCRHIVMEGSLAGELTVLATALWRLAREDRRTRDFTLDSLRGALAELAASFPVYRSYIIERPSAQDRRFVEWAIGRARRHSRAADASVFDFLRRVLLGRPLPGAPAGLGERYHAFTRRLQQYTAPVVAKGIEDTAMYRHHRLISVNDVGGEPEVCGISLAAFHAASRDRALNWPHTMLATSTHDAKRSEDVRARIDVISEMPAAWRLTVRRWSRMNRRHRRTVDGAPAPSRNDEYLLYQTLVGSLPDAPLDEAALTAYALRIDEAMLKSARESKAVTSWISPNAAYEAALSAFVQALLAPRESNLFLPDLQASAAVFAWYGALNGLSMATLKCLSPGVPDFYQGHEAIELRLVDPDNRRAVDWDRRRALLAEARQRDGSGAATRAGVSDGTADSTGAGPTPLRALLAQATDGRAKFHAIRCALALRRRHEALLREAPYLPLEVRGEKAHHIVAFARHDHAAWVVTVAARLYASLGLVAGQLPVGDVWGDTHIVWPEAAGGTPAAPSLEDAISKRRLRPEGGRMQVAALLHDFPVAVLGPPQPFS